MQCFCEMEYDKLGLFGLYDLQDKVYKDSKGNDTPICQIWVTDQTTIFKAEIYVAMITLVVNAVLSLIVTKNI